ncbi:MAG: hypothetical protein ABWZ40_09580 [Caulobacterales bacterium]
MGFLALLLGLLLNCATVMFHVTAVAIALPKIKMQAVSPLGRSRAWETAPIMSVAILGLLVLQLLSAAVWGFVFCSTGMEPNFHKAMFLALIAISALGGDTTALASPWRLLVPLAAINGALLFGLSTAVMFRLVTVFHFSEAEVRQTNRPADR